MFRRDYLSLQPTDEIQTGKKYVSPAGLAIIHSALGETDKAFALLERAYSLHDHQLIWLGIEGGYDPLRADARFQDLMRRIGLAYNRTNADDGK